MRIITLAAAMLAVVLAGCVETPVVYQPAPAAAPPPVQDPATVEQYPQPPPPLPEYDQPPVPAPGYLWVPGVWRIGPAGYFWVPGTWVLPPAEGLLWTPGFWALAGVVYVYHVGYWGPHVGYYGGINYGHGYYGNGYAGGRWVNNSFHYNTAVTNVNVTNIHNTYNETVVNNVNVTNITNVTRVSYAGAPGTRMQPSPEEAMAAREAHVPPTAEQVHHVLAASSEPQFIAARNGGRPPIAATPRPAQFGPEGATPARPGGPAYRPPGQSPPTGAPVPIVHARDVPKGGYSASSAAELQSRHDQERQNLTRQQEQEHANFAQQPVHDHQAYEAMERQHQQQTQQMVQRHQQEIQHASNGGTQHSEKDQPH